MKKLLSGLLLAPLALTACGVSTGGGGGTVTATDVKTDETCSAPIALKDGTFTHTAGLYGAGGKTEDQKVTATVEFKDNKTVSFELSYDGVSSASKIKEVMAVYKAAFMTSACADNTSLTVSGATQTNATAKTFMDALYNKAKA